MQRALDYKIYTRHGSLVAGAMELEDAMAFVAVLFEKDSQSMRMATVRLGTSESRTVWQEGKHGDAENVTSLEVITDAQERAAVIINWKASKRQGDKESLASKMRKAGHGDPEAEPEQTPKRAFRPAPKKTQKHMSKRRAMRVVEDGSYLGRLEPVAEA